MTAPTTRRSEHTDVLHGREVPDPYRWLEDPDAPEVVDWVGRQREYAEQVFSGIQGREWFRSTLREIVQRPRRGAPRRQHGWYLQSRNSGDQPQDVVVAARSLPGVLGEEARVVLDPGQWSAEGTSSLGGYAVSPDGRLLAHAISDAGSDWRRFRVLDLESGELLDDEVVTRFASPLWLPDSATLLYLEWTGAGRADGTDATALSGPVLWSHTLGGQRRELFRFPEDPAVMFSPELCHDAVTGEDWLVLQGSRGTERTNRLWAAPVTTRGGRSTVGPWRTLFADDDHQREVVAVRGGALLFLTHQGALRGRVVSLSLDEPDQPLIDVIAEQEGVLEGVWATASGLLALHLADVAPVLSRWRTSSRTPGRLDVEALGALDLSVGAVSAVQAEGDHDEVFLATSSVAEPGLAWRLDAASGDLTVLPDPDALPILPVVQQRRRAVSADGTEVPYWVVSRADLPLDEQPRPTLAYGYGGFTIPVLADHRPGWRGWLQAGGVLVITNLRGGGEFGQDWYDQGRRAHKQNVFDDFIAVCEHLVSSGTTTPDHLACYGRSNGGLLVGAVITQRPDLFAAALPQVGVLDLLRFHTFTVGAAWISDYGDPGRPEDFEVALAYSPLHQVREGTHYPATLIITGDHDDRVVPAHSHKFTAALQAAQAGPAPIVTRIEPATGHGDGKPARVIADEWADLLAWAAHFTGLAVPEAISIRE